MKKIAILGATGYVGKSLVCEFSQHGISFELFLFSRSLENLHNVIPDIVGANALKYHMLKLEEFSLHTYDVVINCTGIGDQEVLKKDPKSIFSVTESIDEMIISHCEKTVSTMYINFSSGAVYGTPFEKEVTHETVTIVPVNNLTPDTYYSIAKINAEAKHRSLNHLNIVDLRLFSFFSQFVDIKASFLMSEIAGCLESGEVFVTNEKDIIRDYSCPKDLFSLLVCVMKKETLNDFFDIYSTSSVSKFELLAYLEKNYGLQYSVNKSGSQTTGVPKNIYCSSNKKAQTIGYEPTHSSISGIACELDLLLACAKKKESSL